MFVVVVITTTVVVAVATIMVAVLVAFSMTELEAVVSVVVLSYCRRLRMISEALEL